MQVPTASVEQSFRTPPNSNLIDFHLPSPSASSLVSWSAVTRRYAETTRYRDNGVMFPVRCVSSIISSASCTQGYKRACSATTSWMIPLLSFQAFCPNLQVLNFEMKFTTTYFLFVSFCVLSCFALAGNDSVCLDGFDHLIVQSTYKIYPVWISTLVSENKSIVVNGGITININNAPTLINLTATATVLTTGITTVLRTTTG